MSGHSTAEFFDRKTELTRWTRCYPCGHYSGLGGVLPISYSVDNRLESAIWRAKNERRSRWLNIPLASVLNGFLARHLACIERHWGVIDIITPVPSHSGARGGWDHMKDLLGRVRTWPAPERWDLELLEKVDPSTADSRRRDEPVSGLFKVTPAPRYVTGKKILLIDDTYTTGGTLRSAGVSLLAAGAQAPVVVTIGRQVRNDNYGGHIIADALSRQPLFDISQCAIHQ